MYKILIIEDDLTMAQAIQKEMKMWGNDAQYVQDFKNVLETFAEFDPHLVLMDITLPFYNGYHWCSEIRKISNVPVIFISSAADNMNIIMAVNMGGDCSEAVRSQCADGEGPGGTSQNIRPVRKSTGS